MMLQWDHCAWNSLAPHIDKEPMCLDFSISEALKLTLTSTHTLTHAHTHTHSDIDMRSVVIIFSSPIKTAERHKQSDTFNAIGLSLLRSVYLVDYGD